jgi:fructose-specific component phosphotransferase system IIB-like protein
MTTPARSSELGQARAFLLSALLKPRVQAARPKHALETASGGRRVL